MYSLLREPLVANAAFGVELVPSSSVLTALATGRNIELSACSMRPDATMARALFAAGDRGAEVKVELDGAAFGWAASDNRAFGSEAARHHVEVSSSRTPAHLKAALVDGAMYLSDRNWSAGGETTVLKDDRAEDVNLVTRAIEKGEAGSSSDFWTRKQDALDAEARLLAFRSTENVIVETESFGAGTPVFAMLLHLADEHRNVRLIIARREYAESPTDQQAVAVALEHGVHVRLGRSDQKFAVDGADVYIGSANATRGMSDQIDFGMILRDIAIGNSLRNEFEREWAEDIAPN